MTTSTRDIFMSQSGFDPTLLENTVLDGRFKIEKMLGRGGMGAVYRARQIAIDRAVAIKIIIPSESIPKTLEERFFREARIMSGLSHANIVQLYDFGENDYLLYLVMELVEGELVLSLIQRGRLSAPLVREIAYQVASGLIEAHSKGVVHRDLKPGNMLISVGPDGRLRVKIFDFGIAYPRESDVKITKTGLMCGTPAYLAPEQIRGREITESADLYTLGVCLFEMLSGRMPFEGPTMQIMFKHVQESPPRLRDMGGLDVPDDLSDLVERLLAKAPAERPASALEVRQLLEPQLGTRLEFDPSAADPLGPHILRSLSSDAVLPTPAQLITAADQPEPDPQPEHEPFEHASDEVKGAWAAFLSASDKPGAEAHDMVDPNVENFSYTGPTGEFAPADVAPAEEWTTTNDSQGPEARETEIDHGHEIDLSSISNSMPTTDAYEAVSSRERPTDRPRQRVHQGAERQASAPTESTLSRPPMTATHPPSSSDGTLKTSGSRIPRKAILAVLALIMLVASGISFYFIQQSRFTPEEDTLSKEELEEYWQAREEAEKREFEEAAARREAEARKTREREARRARPGDLKKKPRPREKDEEVIDLWDGQNDDPSNSVEIERKR